MFYLHGWFSYIFAPFRGHYGCVKNTSGHYGITYVVVFFTNLNLTAWLEAITEGTTASHLSKSLSSLMIETAIRLNMMYLHYVTDMYVFNIRSSTKSQKRKKMDNVRAQATELEFIVCRSESGLYICSVIIFVPSCFLWSR